jgi:hypothetical protein
MIRSFELKKEQLTILSRQIDPASVNVEAMLLKAGIGASSIVPAANLIELLDHVPVRRSIGLMRSSAGRLRRNDVLYKPLADSVQLETALAWRAENRSSQLLSFRDALIAFGQRIDEVLAGTHCNVREDVRPDRRFSLVNVAPAVDALR